DVASFAFRPAPRWRRRHPDHLPTVYATTVISLPIARLRRRSARPWLTAISTNSFELTYQNACPGGTAEKVRACGTWHPAAASSALSGTPAPRSPLIALP